MSATKCCARFLVLLLDMLGANLANAGDGVSHHHVEWYVALWSEGPIMEVLLMLMMQNS